LRVFFHRVTSKKQGDDDAKATAWYFGRLQRGFLHMDYRPSIRMVFIVRALSKTGWSFFRQFWM
jgi:hypothetical protein